MKKPMIAATSAVVLALASFAAAPQAWFNGGIAEGWPNEGEGLTGGGWSNVGGSLYEGGAVTVNADTAAPLSFEADVPQTLDDVTTNITVTSEIAFTPFAANALPAVPAQAKAGAIVVKVGDSKCFYVLAKVDTANSWSATAIEATAESTRVTVRLAAGKATYSFGDDPANTVTVDVVIDGAVSAANYAGNGVVASLSATYATATVETDPIPASGSETSVVKNDDGEYVLAPTGEKTTVAVEGVNEGDVLVVGAAVTSIGVNGGESAGATIKVRNSGDTATIPNAAMMGWSGNEFSTALNPDAVVEGVKVQPTAIEAESTEGTIADGAVATAAIPGLTYELKRGTELGSYSTIEGATTAKKTATGSSVTLKDDTTKPTTKAFYVIEVTK